MDIRVEGLLVRIRKKLDAHDHADKTYHNEIGKSIEKMVDSLDRLIYDQNYFGKDIPEMKLLAELKVMLKDVGALNPYSDIERIKHKIDGVLINKRARLRLSFNQ